MVDPSRNGLDFRFFQPPDHVIGRDAGRKVDVADGKREEIVAHGAPDVARQPFVGAERGEQPPHAAFLAPLCGVEAQLHCSLRERLTIIAAVAPQILRSSQIIS